ncbi:hypothetical protein BDW02DRAFT_628317 [Decorospora gaudefroyi]|uniref:Non-structural maintenance of chromosomes element 1 homolog n=1 Tax=Decorospora gaudefroyi TaxID=184978 RepID=A0A6A5KIV3_9PLEO|nr:hypothetical protein BDW02DRAFT_628317 [Decorospora gaudefroyi]
MSRTEAPYVRAQSEDEGYNWIHRAFLHALKTHNVLTVDEMKTKLAHVMTQHNPDRPWTAADITQPHLTSTVQTINTRITPYDYEIRSTRDQETKTLIYAFVNNASDSLTQFATTFSASEMGYIRRVLDYMFETNNTKVREVMAIRHTEASQLARVSAATRRSQINNGGGAASESQDGGISLAEADAVLTALVTSSFFQFSSAGYYALAPRALIELRAYLKETYNEGAHENEEGREVVRIRDCEGCREIVTVGVRCNNRECGVRWHDACVSSYFRGRKEGARKCPRCAVECGGDMFVGERADRVGRSGKSGGGGNNRRRSRREVQEEEEDEEDG